jgi:hypothetical protein
MRGVYRLTCNDPELNYYGSSDDIYLRESHHEYNYKYWKTGVSEVYCSSYKLYEVGGVEVEMVLECSEISKREMRQIEQTYIDNDECVNEKNSFVSEEDIVEFNRLRSKKQYSTDEGKQVKKEYYQKNRQARLDYQNERYKAMKFEKSFIDNNIKTI